MQCRITGQDVFGLFDVDEAYLIVWKVDENGVEKSLATGAVSQIPVSAIDMTSNPVIFPDVRRREAYAAVTMDDGETIIIDDNENVLVVETYGL